jgi:hypothetical protein
MNTKYIHHIHSLFHFLMPSPLPLVPTPRKDLFYPPVLPFFLKCVLIVQGVFTLVLQVCLYCAFMNWPPPLCSLLILYHHASLIFNSSLCSVSYYIHL